MSFMKVYGRSCVFLARFSHNVSANCLPVDRLLKIDQKWKTETYSNHDLDNEGSKKQITKEKMYILSMFPYPSGSLHMGHVRVYTIADLLARFYRMKGYEVIHPIGWDAFGLPAENAALERQIKPEVWTSSNIVKMKQQLLAMNVQFDWQRSITTCSPTYYRWTQWLFLKLFKHKLAYQKYATVNWDPVDQTVLANEQVNSEGRSWRSGALVEKRTLNQWFLRITDYAHELNHDLDLLSGWPDQVRTMQRNWIGESHGYEVLFQLDDENGTQLPVFTTRPETLYGVSFIAVSKDHPLSIKERNTNCHFREFLDKQAENAHDGYQLSVHARNPLTHTVVPVYYAPYVHNDYGTSAVMGVPQHNSADLLFWKQMGSPNSAIQVLVSDNEGNETQIMSNDCGKHSFLNYKIAAKSVYEELSAKGLARKKTNYRLRDWLVSRQRYWGTPIPIIHCPNCGAVPVPEEQLPVTLPKLDKFSRDLSVFRNSKAYKEWCTTICPNCGTGAQREQDTLDTFVDSSWYFFRYLSPNEEGVPFQKQLAQKYMPVDIYLGGVEHSILHLLYARFFAKFMKTLGLWVDDEHRNEPFQRLVTQGMVHGKTYLHPKTNRYLKPDELVCKDGQIRLRDDLSLEPAISFEKMSKSKHNGVDPMGVLRTWGSDVVRAHILFSAPVDKVLNWDPNTAVGIKRWLLRVVQIAEQLQGSNTIEKVDVSQLSQTELSLLSELKSLVARAEDNYASRLGLNVLVSDLMKFTNLLTKCMKEDQVRPEVAHYALEILVRCMAPMTPCVSMECWELLRSPGSVFDAWPKMQLNIKEPFQERSIPVQINGKKRLELNVSSDAQMSEEQVIARLKDLKEAQKWMNGQTIEKVIIRPRIINIVLKR